MRWLADECVHSDVVKGLRAAGHDVVYAAEIRHQTVDISLTAEALKEHRILVTEDKDFGEIVFNQGTVTHGIVLLRFPTHARSEKWPRLADAIVVHGDTLNRSYTVITDKRTRSRLLAQAEK